VSLEALYFFRRDGTNETNETNGRNGTNTMVGGEDLEKNLKEKEEGKKGWEAVTRG
jgi:hypothetical protein